MTKQMNVELKNHLVKPYVAGEFPAETEGKKLARSVRIPAMYKTLCLYYG